MILGPTLNTLRLAHRSVWTSVTCILTCIPQSFYHIHEAWWPLSPRYNVHCSCGLLVPAGDVCSHCSESDAPLFDDLKGFHLILIHTRSYLSSCLRTVSSSLSLPGVPVCLHCHFFADSGRPSSVSQSARGTTAVHSHGTAHLHSTHMCCVCCPRVCIYIYICTYNVAPFWEWACEPDIGRNLGSLQDDRAAKLHCLAPQRHSSPCKLDTRAFSRYTRKRLERTHGGVFRLLCLSCSLSLSLLLFLCYLLSGLLSLLSLSPLLLSLVFSLSNDDSDHSSSQLSLCTHGSDL